jgi:hypothetical protein
MSQVAKELLNRNDVVEQSARDSGINIAKLNSEYTKLMDDLPREGYDRISKLYLKQQDSKFNYKNYYVDFVQTLQSKPNNNDKTLFKIISRGRGKSNEISAVKNYASNNSADQNYEIAVKLLDYVDETRGGRRTQRNKNKKRRRTKRRY